LKFRVSGLTTVSRSTPIDQIFPVIERDGAIIVENMIDPETLRRLNTELDESISSTVSGLRTGDPNVGNFSRPTHCALHPHRSHGAKASSNCWYILYCWRGPTTHCFQTAAVTGSIPDK
jgi:hypothetical protein